MSEINIRSDSVDVDQIMRQIRARIREKRGVDYTEEEIRELAAVKLEKFLDPRGVRSDLLEQFRRNRAAMPPPPNFAFEESTIYESHRAVMRWIRRMLNPILKLFFNPNPLIQALHIQSELNTRNARREEFDTLHYEMLHNLVLELTRLGIEVKNLKMRVESMSSRLDFDERRARALEGVVVYRPGAAPPLQPPSGGEHRPAAAPPDPSERRTRRRRRRGRRRQNERGESRPESQNASPPATEVGAQQPQAPEPERPAPSADSPAPERHSEPRNENQGDGGASGES